jgi:periplasmic copper chaperone A
LLPEPPRAITCGIKIFQKGTIMSMFKALLVASTLSLAALAGVAQAEDIKAGDLVISNAWSRQSPKFTDASAGFLVIQNTGKADDRLVKATADITPTVQIHTMKMDGEVMKMVELPDGIPVPAGATVELKPGGLHIMFMGLTALPKEGESFKGTLVFEKAGSVAVTYAVKAPNAGMN